MAEFDSPWKESLDVYFQSFLQLCFPAVHSEIDWTRGYQPLDKELQKLSPRAEVGRRGVDKLLRVWRNSGVEEWILVHIEVQSQRVADMPGSFGSSEVCTKRDGARSGSAACFGLSTGCSICRPSWNNSL